MSVSISNGSCYQVIPSHMLGYGGGREGGRGWGKTAVRCHLEIDGSFHLIIIIIIIIIIIFIIALFWKFFF